MSLGGYFEMEVYLIQKIIDEIAWITEKVCLNKEIAERELNKIEKKFPKFERFKIYKRVENGKINKPV